MNLRIQIIPKTLHFKRPAGTSRGAYTTRDAWYILLTDEKQGKIGIGECAPLPKLSCDDIPDYANILKEACKLLEKTGEIDYNKYKNYPSIIFGMETALLHLKANGLQLWDTPFSRGEEGIPINGLIWMGSFDYMREQIEDKLALGFKCVKLKIGAIDFDNELALLTAIRKHYGADKIQLRVDANGAFTPRDAIYKLNELSKYDIHSIEQPIRQGQWNEMATLCQQSPIPIALDEELIGVNDIDEKQNLLKTIQPQYIILKPTLHGGIKGGEEWITLAKELGIGYWITSALESNIGLNAIAQWCATLDSKMYQGLGTGLLFTDNVDAPLNIKGDNLWFNPSEIDINKMLNWLNS